MKHARLSFLPWLFTPALTLAIGLPGGGGGGPVNPGNPGGEPACSEHQLSPGQSTQRVSVNGVTREYILYVPVAYDGSRHVPLMLDFHPLSSSASYQRNSSGTAAVADREGVIVAYPQGINNAWNIGPCCTRERTVDDVAFARAVVEQVSARACVDDRRVYATGFSNGGGLSYKLACDAADTFAAAAPAAFDMIEEMACTPSRPVSVFSQRGRRDFIVPYNGGSSTPPTAYRLDPITFLGAEGSFNRWGELNNCSAAPRSIGNNCSAFSGCDAGTEVVLCTSNFGGHSGWDANQSWEFLKNHRLPD